MRQMAVGRIFGTPLREPARAVSLRHAANKINHVKKHARRPVGSHRSTVIHAFLATKAETVALPIDFYAMLQVNPSTSRDGIRRAFERYS